MTASGQGVAFDSRIIADVLGLDPADVEERLTTLEKAYAVVRAVEEVALPDRTPSVRFRSVHTRSLHALYGDIPAVRAGLVGRGGESHRPWTGTSGVRVRTADAHDRRA